MKTIRLIFIMAVCQFGFGSIMGQTENSSLVKNFGLGLHIEQYKAYDVDDLNTAPANKIEVIVNFTDYLKVEPEIGFKIGSTKSGSLKNSSIFYGLGIFGVKQINKLNIYAGLRFEYAVIKWEEQNYYYNSTGKRTHKTDRLMAGPAIGGEYYLGENFTIGAEISVKYAELKSKITPSTTIDTDEGDYYFTTDTGLFFRFYF